MERDSGHGLPFFPAGTLFLVTGGAGFIGSNLCEAILKLGYRVRCLDNFTTGRRENLTDFVSSEKFELIEGDIRNFDTCLNACEGVTYVLHQAAWGSVPRSIEQPVFYCENNITGTVNMLEAARQQHAKRFVYASSSSVYGDEPNLPKREGREGNLLSPYALTKRANEEWAKQYWRHYGLETIGLRYFNVFGKRQDPNGAYAAVIPRWIRQLLHGETPVIYGDGKQSRDFTYVENVVQANLRACVASSAASGEVYNIAYGGRVYLSELYHTLAEALEIRDANGAVPEPAFEPERPGDICHSNADISKAREMLGYKPEWDFKAGINEALYWYRNKL